MAGTCSPSLFLSWGTKADCALTDQVITIVFSCDPCVNNVPNFRRLILNEMNLLKFSSSLHKVALAPIKRKIIKKIQNNWSI